MTRVFGKARDQSVLDHAASCEKHQNHVRWQGAGTVGIDGEGIQLWRRLRTHRLTASTLLPALIQAIDLSCRAARTHTLAFRRWLLPQEHPFLSPDAVPPVPSLGPREPMLGPRFHRLMRRIR